MKATYYKDTMHSYMIIPCPPEAQTTGYQYRMLEMNRIDGILQCGLRHIDGTGLLYYDTTGKQSLTGLYEGRKIPGTELFRILEMMDSVSGSLSKYLLDEQHLVLTEDQIFYDFSSGKYYFTYYPGEIVDPEVFRFLADGIDGKDKKAAAAAYRLCSLSGDDRQALREAIREEAAMKDAELPWERAVNGQREENGSQSEPDELSGRERSVRGPADWRSRRYDSNREKNTDPAEDVIQRKKEPDYKADQKKASGKSGTLIRILLIVLLLLGAAGLFAVQLLVYISQRERRLCIAGSILLLLCACLIIAETVIGLRRKNREKKEEESRREPLYSQSDEADLPVFGPEAEESYRLGGDEESNTVCFSDKEMIGRLYGRDRGSRIDLRTLPITIGKAQAYSDVVLADPSVSRVHARIYKGEDGCIEIRDLDSTNGTYVNGEKLDPNEKRRVQRGDEVRFGNVEYEYR